MPEATIFNDDCLSTLKRIPDNLIDSLVTDPPCGIAFMGKEWDSDKGGRDQWCAWMSEIMRECLRVLKPGGHGLVWALPKTSHWTGTALEDAGFEVRDIFTHLFGTGFPKSQSIGKAIDKKLGMEREVVGINPHARPSDGKYNTVMSGVKGHDPYITTPTSEEAKQWDGWHSALKPSCEFWFLVRKPLSERTIVDNVLKWGTGGLNIDASRITTQDNLNGGAYTKDRDSRAMSVGGIYPNGNKPNVKNLGEFNQPSQGRFPSHLLLSHSEGCKYLGKKEVKLNGSGKCSGNTTSDKSMFNIGSKELCHGQGNGKETVDNWQCEDDCPIKMLDEQSGFSKTPTKTTQGKSNKNGIYGNGKGLHDGLGVVDSYGDTGGASRFFYCSKVSSSERGDSKHPTMKSIKLMKYLITMVTPPNGIVLDPFMGSGSTGMACKELGFGFIGIEKENEYFEIAKKRLGQCQI